MMKGKIIYNPILLNMLNPLVLETYVEGNRTLKDSIKIPEVIGILSIEYIRTNPSGDNVYSIKLTNGLSYEIIAPKGDDGVGVLSVKFTRTESNGDKVYTIKLSNGNNFEFVCPKGSPGTTNYNELENKPFIPTKVSELQNDSGYATSQLVLTLILNLINAAPLTLDTLKELADALGNDPEFSVTITNLLGNKANKDDLKPILLEAFEDFDIEAVSNQLNNGGRVVLIENDGWNIELCAYSVYSLTGEVRYMQFRAITGITFDPYNIIDYVNYTWTLHDGWSISEYEIPLTNKYDPVEFNLVRTLNNGVVTYNFGNAKFSKLKEAIDDGKIVHILLDNYCFKLDYQVDSQSYIFSSLILDYGNNGVGVMEVYEGENDSIEASLEQNIFNYKQDTLVSGTNIKTINNKSLLGSGNINILNSIEHWTFTQEGTVGNSTWNTNGHKYSDITALLNEGKTLLVTMKDLDAINGLFVYWMGGILLPLEDTISIVTFQLTEGTNDSINVTSITLSHSVIETISSSNAPTERSVTLYGDDTINSNITNVAKVEVDDEGVTITTTNGTTATYNGNEIATLQDIPAQVNADWNAVSGAAQILNKPTIHEVPSGGNSGQVLKKSSATDYDYAWANQTQDYPSAYCKTTAGTAGKTAACTLWTATANTYLHLVIVYANTSASALTLNVNSTGAKPIYINGSASSSSNYTLPAGSYIIFYDGTNYHFRTDGKIAGPNGSTLALDTEISAVTFRQW